MKAAETAKEVTSSVALSSNIQFAGLLVFLGVCFFGWLYVWQLIVEIREQGATARARIAAGLKEDLEQLP